MIYCEICLNGQRALPEKRPKLSNIFFWRLVVNVRETKLMRGENKNVYRILHIIIQSKIS